MNKKRIAAVIAASTMLLATMPVSAANVSTGSGATVTGGATTTSSGTVNAWDNTPYFEVTLPTNNALQFTVDPYGLEDNTALASGVAVDDLTKNDVGAILAASGSGAVIINDSNVPVLIDAKFSINDTGNTSFASTQEISTDSATKEMFLAIVPSKVSATTVASYSAADYAIPITATGSATTDAQFRLAKAKYNVVEQGGKFKLVKAADNVSDGTVFQVGGRVNANADWASYIDTASPQATISLNAVFEYKLATDSAVVATASGVHGWVDGQTTQLTTYSAVGGAGLPISNVTESNVDGIDYEVTFNKGTKIDFDVTGKTIKTVEVSDKTSSFAANTTHAVKVSNTKFSVPAGAWSGAANNSYRYMKITYSDNTSVIIRMLIKA